MQVEGMIRVVIYGSMAANLSALVLAGDLFSLPYSKFVTIVPSHVTLHVSSP